MQLYVNRDRNRTKEYVQHAEKRGCKALFITVDAPMLGKREKDMRNKYTKPTANVQTPEDKAAKVDRTQGAARAISSFIDPTLNWKDLKWFQSITKMPIILKGVQCAEDAVMAAKAGMDGIVISNHGGRQLDNARSAIEVLPEVVEALKAEGLHGRMEILCDGGFRRGADVFKAVALGATAVGVGRPALYSMASHGQDGVERMLEILKEELEMTMALMGTPSIADIDGKQLITRNLADHMVPQPHHHLLHDTYEPLVTQSKL
jgi:L-lactate dehydrogenase (cytochrome)